MATSEVVMRPLATTMISVEKLIPTRAQDPAVVSLAESIAAHGLLVPLLARYDLRAGHRRLVACSIEWYPMGFGEQGLAKQVRYLLLRGLGDEEPIAAELRFSDLAERPLPGALAVAWPGDSVVPQVAQDFGVRDWKLYDKLVGGDFDALELLLEKVIYTWLEVLLPPRLRHDAVAALPEIERAVCKIWGQVCWKDYLAAAAIELPEPKSWAALNADGTSKAQKAQKGKKPPAAGKKAKGKAKPVA